MNPKSVHETIGYSHAGYFDGPGRVVYISGQVARNEKGETVGKENVEEQTRQAYQNLSSILSSMGGNLGNVIKRTSTRRGSIKFPPSEKYVESFLLEKRCRALPLWESPV